MNNHTPFIKKNLPPVKIVSLRAPKFIFLYFFKIRRNQGVTPLYFPEKFGKLIGVKNRPKEGGQKEFMLTYEIDEVMTSMVTLQISADDIILIYNRSGFI